MKHITIERHWHFFPEEKMDKFKTKHCSKVNWTYMAAFTTAEKPNIKYHWELNPVKFRPLEQHCEIHICGVHLHWWLRTRFVSGEEDVQTQAAQKPVQLVKGANFASFSCCLCHFSAHFLSRCWQEDMKKIQWWPKLHEEIWKQKNYCP
jgi:hypothetical protein